MQGQRLDNLSVYLKDMHKTAFMAFEMEPEKRSKVFKIRKGAFGAGEKESQVLELDLLDRHLAEGQDIAFEFPAGGWDWYMRFWTYSKGLSLSYEANEDSIKIKNLLQQFANKLGSADQRSRETFAARVFNEGGNLSGDWIFNGSHTGETDPSGDLMYDSKPLFNLSGNVRTTKGGGTYYNSVASINLTYANFKTVFILHTATNNVDELDFPAPNRADTILMTPGQDEAAAIEVLQTPDLPDSELNNKNPYFNRIKNIVVWDYLNDIVGTDQPFFVGKAQSDKFEFVEREAPVIRFFTDHNNAGSKAYYLTRFGVFIKDFRVWTRGGGTSA